MLNHVEQVPMCAGADRDGGGGSDVRRLHVEAPGIADLNPLVAAIGHVHVCPVRRKSRRSGGRRKLKLSSGALVSTEPGPRPPAPTTPTRRPGLPRRRLQGHRDRLRLCPSINQHACGRSAPSRGRPATTVLKLEKLSAGREPAAVRCMRPIGLYYAQG